MDYPYFSQIIKTLTFLVGLFFKIMPFDLLLHRLVLQVSNYVSKQEKDVLS